LRDSFLLGKSRNKLRSYRNTYRIMNHSLIYGLLLSILMVTAPHADHLPLWVSALCIALLTWRAYLTSTGNPLPNAGCCWRSPLPAWAAS